MASTTPEDPDYGHAHRREVLLAVFLGLVAAGFGARGLWIYEVKYGPPPDVFSVAYHTLQLFLLHAPHLDHTVPWQLHVGRWLAAIVVLVAVVRGLLTVFRSEFWLWVAHFRRGHIVICGLGRLGIQLAHEFRRNGFRVVAIERSGAAGSIATAANAGVAVLVGDATSPATLSHAAVDRASKIIAVCDDEQTNVAIAATVGELLAGRRSAGESSKKKSGDACCLECWIFITDPRLRQTFQLDQLFPHTGEHYQVNVRGLDLFELAARQVLRRVPLDYERINPADSTIVHLVIVGFGSMGQHLAMQAARIGHFANFKKLRITVVEQKDSERTAVFTKGHKKFADVCDFASPDDISGDPLDPDVILRFLPRSDPKELVSVALCWDSSKTGDSDQADFLQGLERDDATNLSLALAIAQDGAGSRNVLAFQTRKAGFASLFPVEGRSRAIGPQVRAFGMLEEAWSLEALFHEREDRIARALHEDFLEKKLADGKRIGERPAFYHWEQLPERFRDSNRRAADHIRVKLRAIGYRLDDIRRDLPPVQSFNGDQTELLARMEHESWCAELLLQNYSYGPKRDDVAKTHPYLVPWDKLDDDAKQWDRDQVKAIPEALKLAGYGIYPQVQ